MEAGTEGRQGLPSGRADPACLRVDLRADPVEGTVRHTILRTARHMAAAGIADTVAVIAGTTSAAATAIASAAAAVAAAVAEPELASTALLALSSTLPAVVATSAAPPTAAIEPSTEPLAEPSSVAPPRPFSVPPPATFEQPSAGPLAEPSKLPLVAVVVELPRLVSKLPGPFSGLLAAVAATLVVGLVVAIVAAAIGPTAAAATRPAIEPATRPIAAKLVAMLAAEPSAAKPVVEPIAEPTSEPTVELVERPQQRHRAKSDCLRRWAGWVEELRSPCLIHWPECLEVVVEELVNLVAEVVEPVLQLEELVVDPVTLMEPPVQADLQPEFQEEEVEVGLQVEASHNQQEVVRILATRRTLVAVRPFLADHQASRHTLAEAVHIQATLHSQHPVDLHSLVAAVHPCQAVLRAALPWRADLLEASPGRRPGQAHRRS